MAMAETAGLPVHKPREQEAAASFSCTQKGEVSEELQKYMASIYIFQEQQVQVKNYGSSNRIYQPPGPACMRATTLLHICLPQTNMYMYSPMSIVMRQCASTFSVVLTSKTCALQPFRLDGAATPGTFIEGRSKTYQLSRNTCINPTTLNGKPTATPQECQH